MGRQLRFLTHVAVCTLVLFTARARAGDPADAASDPVPAAVESRPRRWALLSIRQDFAWIDGDRVCSPAVQSAGELSCFRKNGTPYIGTPRAEDSAKARGIAVATTRILASYQHFLGTHWALAVLAGVVLRGGGPRPAGGSAFFPFHLEGQLSWWPAGPPARGGGLAPFLLLGGGLAQVDSKLSLDVREDPNAPLPPSQIDNPAHQTLDVYEKSGTGFGGFGGGIAVATSPTLLWRLALEGVASFPAPGIGAGLEAGVGFDL
jgi:hypothetical protein